MNLNSLPFFASLIVSSAICFGSQKPSVVVITNDIHDAAFKERGIFTRNRLTACGFNVVPVNQFKDFDELKSKLASLKLGENTTVFMQSHGFVLNDQFLFGIRDVYYPNDPVFSFTALSEALATVTKKSNVWLHSCESGACLVEKIDKSCKVGATCRVKEFGKISTGPVDDPKFAEFMEQEFETKIVDLMCSGNQDCSLWNKVDGNHDGTITGSELTTYFAAFGLEESVPDSPSHEYDSLDPASRRWPRPPTQSTRGNSRTLDPSL